MRSLQLLDAESASLPFLVSLAELPSRANLEDFSSVCRPSPFKIGFFLDLDPLRPESSSYRFS